MGIGKCEARLHDINSSIWSSSVWGMKALSTIQIMYSTVCEIQKSNDDDDD